MSLLDDIAGARRVHDELRVRKSEVAAKVRKPISSVSDVDEISGLLAEFIRVKRDYFEARRLLGQLMLRAWQSEVPLRDIAEAYGKSVNTTYLFVSRLPGFTKRYGNTTQTNQ